MDAKRYKLNKTSAPKIAIMLATMLAVIKGLAGFMSGSLAVLSSAMDSLLDILASSINYVMIKKADEPPDKEHNFGHGKYEAYASFLQSILIFGTGGFLLYKAFLRIRSGEALVITSLAGIVMCVSIVVSFGITLMLRFTAEREGSLALKADAAHYAMDLLTNSGVLIALIVIKVAGLIWVDSVIAILLAVYIMYSALKIHIAALKIILDARIPDNEKAQITAVLDKYSPYFKNYHRFRARTDGYKIFVDLHLLLSGDLTLKEAHALCDVIEDEMPKNIDMTIHPESSDIECVDKCCSRDSVLQLLEARGVRL